MTSCFDVWKNGASDDPGQIWLAQLLYLLERSHEDLLKDAKDADGNMSAHTHKRFVDTFALQIWKAANGYEYFLNDRLVDFEGDTEFRLAVETDETGPHLIWITSEDMMHLVLPMSPEVAIIFCNESRFWESPFAEALHQSGIPYPENSLLSKAPHRDIINVDVPKRKRGRKTWPATTAWRVSIGTLSQQHHRLITSYSLSHTCAVLIVHKRSRFEKAKRELEQFIQARLATWRKQGVRSGVVLPNHSNESRILRRCEAPRDALPSQEQLDAIADSQMSSLAKAMEFFSSRAEEIDMTKENALIRAEGLIPESNEKKSSRLMPSFVQVAFEAAYPPRHPEYRDLKALSFAELIDYGTREETFANLMTSIGRKITELIDSEACVAQAEADKTNNKETSPIPEMATAANKVMRNPWFQGGVQNGSNLRRSLLDVRRAARHTYDVCTRSLHPVGKVAAIGIPITRKATVAEG
ncbi:hypothetical protein EK21DRAFT_94566 [Setomelanomma holmii]|uniref:Uncharacterized protein n=1 Tax=Setomelanomma holmii TaxID=210430 RepID=A0A9P4GVT0_9PLEO|nr:hypothetical protein EK21DRAFT_94566 [Setomelanomma holmii]